MTTKVLINKIFVYIAIIVVSISILVDIHYIFNNKVKYKKGEFYINFIDSLEKVNLVLSNKYDSIYFLNIDRVDSINILNEQILINNKKYEELIDSYNSYSDNDNVIIFNKYLSEFRKRQY